MTIPFIEENDQTIARKEHLEKLRSSRQSLSNQKELREKYFHFQR